MNNAWPWLLAGNSGFGGLGGGNFWGAGIGGFLGSALGNWIGNNGGLGGNGNGAAAALGAQATANSNTELLRAAISSNGEQSRQAIQTISTMLGQDFATVSSQFGAINGILNNMAVQNATTPLQIVNAIVSGNKDLAAEFANCCCQNKLLVTEQGYQGQMRTMEQTAAMQNGFAGVNTNIAATKAAQELSDCKQTYTLTDANNRNTQAILAKLDQMTTQALQDKLDAARAENTVLRGEISQSSQNQYFANLIGQAMAPVNAQLAALNREVDDIKCKIPNTVPVQYPNITAVNTTPFMNGGFYGNGGFVGGNNILF
ncbi:MAG: hypothetical protein IJR13_07570 [Bacteroidales bacterium]|nr:hypothetical protein [Bacteroidales bacterium]